MNKPSLNELISLAQQGNMNAQYLLGQSYYRTKITRLRLIGFRWQQTEVIKELKLF